MSRKLQLSEAVTGLIREKGSKFLAFLYPITQVEDVAPLLEQLRNEHPTARHWCYAYRLGEDGSVYRFNDDGEPSGSAGRPILNAIDSAGLTNTLAVVVRYFGGTLLGVRGLIDAYGGAVEDALHNATLIPVIRWRSMQVSCKYTHMADLQKVMNDLQLKPHQTTYENDGMCFEFLADEAVIEPFKTRLAGLFGVNVL